MSHFKAARLPRRHPVEDEGDVTMDRLEVMMLAGRSQTGSKGKGKAKEDGNTLKKPLPSGSTGVAREQRDQSPRLVNMARAPRDPTPVHNWGAGDEEGQSGEGSDVYHQTDHAAGPGREDRENRFASSSHSEDEDDGDDQLFFVDTAGDASMSIATDRTSEVQSSSKIIEAPGDSSSNGLLLPEHVQLGGLSQQAREQAAKDYEVDGAEGDFLQLDAKADGAARYYEADREAELDKHKECGACGETGHMRKECPHEQCLACGALDEHSTRNCPLRVSCFRCGAHGHMSRDCPSDRRVQYQRECSRCGAPNHNQTTCPTLWRIYVYRDEKTYRAARKQKSIDMRKEQALFGGELDDGSGSSEDEPEPRDDWDPAECWCYNCAARGDHWGDDCPYDRIAYRRTAWTASIFSQARANDGPFASALAIAQPASRSGRRYEHPHVYGMSVGPSSSVHVYGQATPSSSRGPPPGRNNRAGAREDRSAKKDRGAEAFNKNNPTQPSESQRKRARKEESAAKNRERVLDADDDPTIAWDVDAMPDPTDSPEDADGGKKARRGTKRRGTRGSGKSAKPGTEQSNGTSGAGSFNFVARLARRDSLDEQRDYHVAAARKAAATAAPAAAASTNGNGIHAQQTTNERQAQSDRDRAANEEKRRRREQSERDRGRTVGEAHFGPFSKDSDDQVRGGGDFDFDFESDFRGGGGRRSGGSRTSGAGRKRSKSRDRGWDREPDRWESRHNRDQGRGHGRSGEGQRDRWRSSGGASNSSARNGRSAGPMYKGGYH